MKVTGDFANRHLSALGDENLHWNLACDYMSQIFLYLPHRGPTNTLEGKLPSYLEATSSAVALNHVLRKSAFKATILRISL